MRESIFVNMQEYDAKKLVIAADHAGFEVKEKLREHLAQRRLSVEDVGTFSAKRTDYPDHAHRAVSLITAGGAQLGVLVCGSGNGVNMAANKHTGIRSALAWVPEIAALARQHNDANVVAIPARFVTMETAIDIVDAFIGAEFEGGRHQKRVQKIEQSQRSVSK